MELKAERDPLLDARTLVIATPDSFRARKMIEIARALNPNVETVVRTQSEEEAVLLRKENAGTVFLGEQELALGMARHVIERFAQRSAPPAAHRVGSSRLH